jgi:hypothetical protein
VKARVSSSLCVGVLSCVSGVPGTLSLSCAVSRPATLHGFDFWESLAILLTSQCSHSCWDGEHSSVFSGSGLYTQATVLGFWEELKWYLEPRLSDSSGTWTKQSSFLSLWVDQTYQQGNLALRSWGNTFNFIVYYGEKKL